MRLTDFSSRVVPWRHHFVIQVPQPPEGKRPAQEAFVWFGGIQESQPKNDPNYQCVIRIADRKPAGGTTSVDIRASIDLGAAYEETHESNAPGSKSPRTSVKEGKYELRFTAVGDTRCT